MSYNLFLDDIRSLSDTYNYMKDPRYNTLDWVIVRNFNEFKNAIDQRGVPDLVSYDHDLGAEHYDESMYHSVDACNKVSENFTEKTGLDCTKYLISKLKKSSKHPDYLIHSWNPVGKINIRNTIQDFNENK